MKELNRQFTKKDTGIANKHKFNIINHQENINSNKSDTSYTFLKFLKLKYWMLARIQSSPNSHILLEECKKKTKNDNNNSNLENSLARSYKDVHLPDDQVISLLKKWKQVNGKIGRSMFIAGLNIIIKKSGNSPNIPSQGNKWQIVAIHSMEY